MPEGPVKPTQRGCHTIAAVEHADVLHAARECQAPRAAVGKTAVGDALVCFSACRALDDAIALLVQHGSLQRTVDHQQVARGPVKGFEGKQRNGNRGLHCRMSDGIANDDVRSHRVPEKRETPIVKPRNSKKESASCATAQRT